MRRFLWLGGLLCFVSCAAFQPVPVSEKELGIPTELADKFAPKDAANVQPPAPPAPGTPEAAAAAKAAVAPIVETRAEMKAKEKKTAKEKLKKEPKKVAKKDLWPNRWTIPPPFQAGDRVLFDITYFGATAGTLELKVLQDKVVDNRPTYHVQAIAATSSVFALFYRLYDVVESFIDQHTIIPIKFTLKMDESLQDRDIVELYDHSKQKMYFWSKWNHKKKGLRMDNYELDTGEFPQDSISAFFYIRTLPLHVGDKYRFMVSNNGKMKEVQISVIRKEKLTTRVGDIDSIVVQPEVVLDGVLKKTGDSFIWIADDPHRSLLKIDAKVKVGSVIAYLRELDIAGVPVGGRTFGSH